MSARLREAGIDPQKPEVKRAVSIAASVYAGPIPPAEMLADYERIRPGLADRIIGWTEQQQRHRHKLEAETTRGAEGRMDRGQIYSFTLGALSIVAASIVAIFNTAAAIAIMTIGVGGPAAATIIARTIRPRPDRGGDTPSREAGDDQAPPRIGSRPPSSSAPN